MTLFSKAASHESIYTSAPNSDLEDHEGFALAIKHRQHEGYQRPSFLSGSSESSLIDDTTRRNHYSLSTLHSLTEKFNRMIFKRKFELDLEDLEPENEIRVRILGFETIERERRLTVKLRTVPKTPRKMTTF